MKKYIMRRILFFIPMLFVITFLSFSMIKLAGSDVVLQKMDASGVILSDELIQAKRTELGLNRPFFLQYASWLGNFLKGDMGNSYVSGESVRSLFLSKLPATLLLTAASLFLTVIFSIPLGIATAIRPNTRMDYLFRICSFIGNSLPNFFVAFLLMYVFSIEIPIFPVISTGTNVMSVILPAATLSIAMSAKYLRQVRTVVLEELNKDYVIAAKARGIQFSRTLWKSVLPNCLVTILTFFSLSIGSLLGGTAVVESIFMWDGIGKLAVDSIQMRDYPVMQAYVVWMSVIYAVINLVMDIVYCMIDPRIRIGGESE